MARKPIKPSKAARNQRKQDERKLHKQFSQLQRELTQGQVRTQQALVQARQALEQAKQMGQYSQQLVAGAMSAINVSQE